MNDQKSNEGQSGGVNFGGGNVNVGGDVVGRDKVTYNVIPRATVDQAFQPLALAIGEDPDAQQKLEALKDEVAKGKQADDGLMAKLVDGLAALVPGAVSAVVSAFGSPLLSGIAGPATQYVLEKIRGD